MACMFDCIGLARLLQKLRVCLLCHILRFCRRTAVRWCRSAGANATSIIISARARLSRRCVGGSINPDVAPDCILHTIRPALIGERSPGNIQPGTCRKMCLLMLPHFAVALLEAGNFRKLRVAQRLCTAVQAYFFGDNRNVYGGSFCRSCNPRFRQPCSRSGSSRS